MGARVVALDLRFSSNDHDTHNDKLTQIVCNVTDSHQVTECIKHIEAEIGPITALVNNAGVVVGKSLLALTEQEIKRTLNVNLLAHYWTVRAVLPLFQKRVYGHILTVASSLGTSAVADLTDYCASKFAAIGFHESLRQELIRMPTQHHIHTTLLCPGLILTGMFDGLTLPYSFLTPPLRTDQVVSTILEALFTVAPIDISQIPIISKMPEFIQNIWIQSIQHKSILTPSSFILASLAQMLCPLWISDLIKQVTGANDALRHNFHTRPVRPCDEASSHME